MAEYFFSVINADDEEITGSDDLTRAQLLALQHKEVEVPTIVVWKIHNIDDPVPVDMIRYYEGRWTSESGVI